MRSLLRYFPLLMVFVSCAAPAQQYPVRAVRVYIPFTAGSAADIIMRAMEPQMREKLGQSFVIDNRGGAGGNIAAELFSVMTGIKMVHVPYKGATEALTALLGGQTDLQFASLSSAIPLVKSGRLRAFAVTGAQRSPSIPEMPTMSEAALPGYEASAWFGLLRPAGMPPAAVTARGTAAFASLQTQEVKDRLFASGVEVRTMPADQFARFIDSEIKK